MKKFTYLTVLISLSFTFAGKVAAQEIRIEGTKFVYPIVAKWVDEYKKENPNVQLNIQVDPETESASALVVVANRLPDSEVSNNKVVYVGRYALLPVANKNNALLAQAKKGLKKKELQKLIFEKELLDDEDYEEGSKEKYTATVYSRSGEAQTTRILAKHFGRSPEHIKGKKIIGDEIYLLNALRKDENGVAYNTLNYVYDLKTRRLKSELAILPLSLKQEVREKLLSYDVDQAISALEATEVETIPVEQFGIVIPAEYAQNDDVLKFAAWVLSKGQQYNHELGFLTLDANTLSAQQKALSPDNESNLSYRTHAAKH